MKQFAGKKKKYRLSVMVAVLPVVGFMALLSIWAADLYVSSRADRAFIIGQHGSEIAWQLAEQRLLETEYLHTLRTETLKKISLQSQIIREILEKLMLPDIHRDVYSLISQISEKLKSHQLIFSKAGNIARKLADSRINLQTHFDYSDNYLKTAIDSIIEEETQLTILQGLNLPENKMALRSGLKEILSFNASVMLNMNELLAFGDTEKFEERQEILRKKMDISLNNTHGVLLSVNEDIYSDLWDKIIREYETVTDIQNAVYTRWKNLKNIHSELEKSSRELKETIQLTVNKVKNDMNTIKRTGFAISTATIVFAVLLLSLISFLLIRSITNLLRRVVAGLNQVTGQITDSSAKILHTSQQLSEGSSGQSAAIEQTSAALEQISAMTKHNADNAGNADMLMKESNSIIGEANSSMTRLAVSMEKISDASENTSRIVKTIDEIAFQTNLLALNAAVEAARAGESGAGFAVVAGEVRNLAMRASAAAKSTAGLIEKTVTLIKEGEEHVGTSVRGFEKTIESTAEVGNLLAEIATASREQAQGIEQVNISVSSMEKIIYQFAGHSRDSRNESEGMNNQIEKMKIMVDDLLSLAGGAGR
ncbi:MAG: methyl-accepting chemotaxis protein [Desulfococcaceae bacterium]|jgi:methyl-accepting chemotaxis protein|nr:methyl-accepting chemotaxis protein [Desulfococcaceae bacterium]